MKNERKSAVKLEEKVEGKEEKEEDDDDDDDCDDGNFWADIPENERMPDSAAPCLSHLLGV